LQRTLDEHRGNRPVDAIEGIPADSDWHLDRGNTNAAWALHKEKEHGKPLSEFTKEDWAIAGELPRRKARRQARRKQAWTGWGPALYPPTRQVPGWTWDKHLDAYIANRPGRFACACNRSFDTPSGFHVCACGKQYNSYVIGTGGSNREAAAEKFLVREVPVREGVIVANRKQAAPYERLPGGDLWPADRGSRAMSLPTGRPGPKSAPKPQPPTRSYGEVDADIERGRRPGGPFSDEAMEKIRRGGTVQLVDPRTGAIHNLVDPGEMDPEDGEDPGLPTMKRPPSDWHRRDRNQRWVKT
jgi:hypothetical protein